MGLVDLTAEPPPPLWGVGVDAVAIQRLAHRWRNEVFAMPAFDYPGTPAERDESWWFDYTVASVGVLACLWPPEGDCMWATEFGGEWLDDAPGIFAAFTRLVDADRFAPEALATLGDEDGAALFAGRGTLQLVPERVQLLRDIGATLIDRWGGSARHLVEEAGRDGRAIAALLTATMPGYLDRPVTDVGTLPFDKLAHLASAVMAAGLGWDAAGFTGYDDFPVYPDYMLPRVLRHHEVLRYTEPLAAQVDGRVPIPADTEAEHAIRWATVFAGARIRGALAEWGRDVPTPAIDYRLWSEAVLGPDADHYGEHHRTVTLRY